MRILKLFILFSIVLLGCKTEEPQNPPTVITKIASDVTLKNATLNGEVTIEGFSATSDRGFVFSDKNTNPSVSDTKVQSGYGKGVYSIVLDKLPVNTKYYYKAYATNTKGTAYGEVQSFTTADYSLSSLTTELPKSVGYTTAELGGIITNDGGATISERGVCFGLNPNPTIADNKVISGKGIGSYTLNAVNLKDNSKYYARAYAINVKGTAYGNEHTFTTIEFKFPTITTDKPYDINYYSAKVPGTVTDVGGSSVSERGICYSLSPNPTISEKKVVAGAALGNGLGSFFVIIPNLMHSSKYYVRSYAINSKGTSYGNEQVFNTFDNKTTITEVKSKTGRIWMDRNLGASQAATSTTDFNSYGDLYQWGRGTDGHQMITSLFTGTLSDTDTPSHGLFISGYKSPYMDWRSSQNDNLWQGVNGTNNPCPVGFRLPTDAEWDLERLSWSSQNDLGAFASPLKLPIPGIRNPSAGNLTDIGTFATYWSGSPQRKLVPTDNNPNAFRLSLGWNIASVNTHNRAGGGSIRCIKD